MKKRKKYKKQNWKRGTRSNKKDCSVHASFQSFWDFTKMCC